MTQEIPKTSRARLLELPIQIETNNFCTKHKDCQESKAIMEGLNSLIKTTSRGLVAFTLAEYLIRIFVKDGFEQSLCGGQSEERLKAGIRHYIETAFEYVRETELELIETTNIVNSKGFH
jgi:hypothetical protein